MKKGLCAIMIVLVVGCTGPEAPSIPGGSEKGKYKEAFLKSKNVNSFERNIDEKNSLSMDFQIDFPGQLIEFRFEASKIYTPVFLLRNGQANQSAGRDIHLGELKIELNGNDITSCVLNECNETKCTGTSKTLAKFSGDLNTDSVYINLSKISLKNAPDCAGITLSPGISNITFKENSHGTMGSPFGAYISTQVISYNRPYLISDIQDVLEE
jgi:hypothetical protein